MRQKLLLKTIMLALIMVPSFGQNHPNGVDFLIEGLQYPDFTYAGVPGGIPANPPGNTYTVSGFDRAAVQAAVDDAAANGGGIVYLPAGNYSFDDMVNITSDNIVIRGAGIDQTNVHITYLSVNDHESAAFTFTGGGNVKNSKFIMADVEKGDRVIELDDASIFNDGDFIKLYVHTDDMIVANGFYRKKYVLYKEGVSWSFSHQAVYLIESVDGNFITLSQPIRFSFKKPDDLNTTLGTFVRPMQMIQNCGVEGMTITSDKFYDKMETSGISFEAVYACWIQDVKFIKAGSLPYNIVQAKNVEVRDIDVQYSWNMGGGGNGYLVQWYTSDGLVEDITVDSLRHAPVFQGYANGCVTRNSTFTRQNGDWHGGWTVENLYENCTMFKDASEETSGLNALSSNRLNDEFDGHQPHLHGQVIYNCDLEIDRPQCESVRPGGLHDNWIWAYNKIENYDQESPVLIGDYADGLIFKGNYIAMENYTGKADEYGVHFWDTGWDTTNLEYSASEDTHYESIIFEDNTFYGIPASKLWSRTTGNVGNALTDNNNTVVEAYSDPGKPTPAIPSIYQYQKDMKANQPNVQFTAPTSILQSSDFTVTVTADASNNTYGSLAKIVLYDGETELTQSTSSTLNYTFSTAGLNRFARLKAEAVYDSESFYTKKEVKVEGGACTAPSIDTDISLSSLTATVGDEVTFSITASGSSLTYEWRKDGSAITGAPNSNSYTISTVATGDAGDYSCYVSNSCGNATSSSATLTVTEAPIETNLALNKDVVFSGFQSPNDNLVDGDVSNASRWSQNTFPEWAEVDLGQDCDITKFEVYPYQGRAYQYKIELKPDGGSYSQVVDRLSNTTGASVLTDEVNASGRYVKITVEGASGYTGSWVSLNELMVFGTEGTTPPPPTTYTLTTNVGTGGVDVTVNPDQASYDEDEEVTLTPNAQSGYEFLEWTGTETGSSNPLVINMTEDENITANFSPILVSSVSIDQGNLNKNVGDDDVQLTVTVNPSDALDKSVTWAPSSSSVAYVNSSGLLTIVGAGEETITATSNDGSNKTGSITVTVADLPTVNDTIQAEDFTSMSGITTNDGISGYNGTGYVDYGDDGTWAEWTYNAASSGTVTVDLRYTNGSSTRPLAITVDGVPNGSFDCVNTGDWFTWTYISVDITVSAGDNTIRLTADPDQGPNIDELVFRDLRSSKAKFSPLSEAASVRLFPNPTSVGQGFTLELTGFENEANATVSIMDISGRVAYSTVVQTKHALSHSLDIGSLSRGMYMVTVRSGNKMINKRLIVK